MSILCPLISLDILKSKRCTISKNFLTLFLFHFCIKEKEKKTNFFIFPNSFQSERRPRRPRQVQRQPRAAAATGAQRRLPLLARARDVAQKQTVRKQQQLRCNNNAQTKATTTTTTATTATATATTTTTTTK